MFIWATTKRPMILALRLLDGQVVDRCKPELHQAISIKLPVLIAIGAKPISGIVMLFIGETNSNAVCVAGPKLLDQPIIEFPGPLAFQKLNDLISSVQEFSSISPARVNRVRQSYLFRITRIPGVFGRPNLLNSSLASERW